MFVGLLVGLATLWSAVVLDVIAEGASSGGTKISVVGHSLTTLAPQTGVIYLSALAASAAIALVASVALVSSRRLERRMAADLDARWEEISRNEMSETRHELFEWRKQELGSTLETLMAKRDGLLDEMEEIRRRTAALREAVIIPEVDLGDDVSTVSTESCGT